MHKLYELKEKLMRELEDYSENGKFSKEDVEAIKYITSAVDHICNIVERAEEEEEGGSSYAGGGSGQSRRRGGGSSYRRGGGSSYRRGGGSSYEGMGGGGSSYTRGRGRNARRDSMGRYSSEMGYSGAEEDFRMDLEELIEDAPNEQLKQKMRQLMQEV